jgi:DNA modification methylase
VHSIGNHGVGRCKLPVRKDRLHDLETMRYPRNTRKQRGIVHAGRRRGNKAEHDFRLDHGRSRTTVWEYRGFNSFGRDRDELLTAHPTVKPVALVADAIKDCSKRGNLILDPFGGSGTTMIAAEKTKRRAALMELDPRYVDTIIRRWQAFTGKEAVCASTEATFAAREVEVKALGADLAGLTTDEGART